MHRTPFRWHDARTPRLPRTRFPAALCAVIGLLAIGAQARADETDAQAAPICTDRPTKANATCTVPDGAWQIEIIDVLARPELAEQARILATPTLTYESASRPRRIVGDLSDTKRVLEFLGIEPDGDS